MGLAGGGPFEEPTTVVLQDGYLAQGIADTELRGSTECAQRGRGQHFAVDKKLPAALQNHSSVSIYMCTLPLCVYLTHMYNQVCIGSAKGMHDIEYTYCRSICVHIRFIEVHSFSTPRHAMLSPMHTHIHPPWHPLYSTYAHTRVGGLCGTFLYDKRRPIILRGNSYSHRPV